MSGLLPLSPHPAQPAAPQTALVDRFSRQITYVHLSVTDRRDLRCTYCMAETMTFLPRAQLLTLEELGRLGRALVSLGVRKLRVTATGRLLLCLGREHSLDLGRVLRANPTDDGTLRAAIGDAMALKPLGHQFSLDGAPPAGRYMNATGG